MLLINLATLENNLAVLWDHYSSFLAPTIEKKMNLALENNGITNPSVAVLILSSFQNIILNKNASAIPFF